LRDRFGALKKARPARICEYVPLDGIEQEFYVSRQQKRWGMGAPQDEPHTDETPLAGVDAEIHLALREKASHEKPGAREQ